MAFQGNNTSSPEEAKKSQLRCGFTSGTAVVAAAVAAIRHILTGTAPKAVDVRLPSGTLMEIPVCDSGLEDGHAWARVIKDGGDDPDVTHRAEFRVRVGRISRLQQGGGSDGAGSRDTAPNGSFFGIRCAAGTGVGTVTKPGLPVKIGEPAINPVPRQMLSTNISEELMRHGAESIEHFTTRGAHDSSSKPHVLLPFIEGAEELAGILVDIEIEVPKGAELARRTLNPRLGIFGGISILGTTGIVRPFSHEAYEETIRSALSVASSNACAQVVLSTGGKSERYARDLIPELPEEAFIQIADFFAFSVREACAMGFSRIVHSAFFGKVVKMANGYEYTHAHKAALDLDLLARLAAGLGHDDEFCRELAEANTARHALEHLSSRQAGDVILAVSRQALQQSIRFAEGRLSVRLLLFDYDGTLLADLEEQCT